jgi:hypothetical protein
MLQATQKSLMMPKLNFYLRVISQPKIIVRFAQALEVLINSVKFQIALVV